MVLNFVMSHETPRNYRLTWLYLNFVFMNISQFNKKNQFGGPLSIHGFIFRAKIWMSSSFRAKFTWIPPPAWAYAELLDLNHMVYLNSLPSRLNFAWTHFCYVKMINNAFVQTLLAIDFHCNYNQENKVGQMFLILVEDPVFVNC